MFKDKRRVVIGIITIVIIALSVFYFTSDYRQYNSGIKNMDTENYEEAKLKFANLNNYKDSKELLKECELELTPEKRFLRSLRDSVNERWEKEDPTKITLENSKKEYPDRELTKLLSYNKESYNDDLIGSSAKIYIEALQNESKSFILKDSKTDKAKQMHEKAIEDKMEILINLINEGQLTLDEKYKDKIEKINESVVVELENKQENEAIQNMLDNVEFVRLEDNGSWANLYFNIENTTNLSFKRIWFIVDGYDEDGNSVVTQDIVIENLKPGDKTIGMGSADNIPNITENTKFKYRLLDDGDATIIDYKN